MNSWQRPAYVAGSFYTKDAEVLRRTVEKYCSPLEQTVFSKVVMAPHAGYMYSGRFAGEVYRRVKIPDRIFVLCPNHTGKGELVSVWSQGEWTTPLGSIAVDEDLAQAVLKTFGDSSSDRKAHLYEHAIEVHLPFLQVLNPKAKIVPIVLGPILPEECQKLGEALASIIGNESMLIVASSDMSHYIPAVEAKALDALALKEVIEVNGESLYKTVVKNDISMCGYIPTSTALFAARKMGAKKGEIVSYGNSGEETGDMNSVVAYAGAIIL